MSEAATEKITAAMQECKEKRVPAGPIAEFLTRKCGEDEAFGLLVAQEHKTLAKCFNFVHEQVRKHLDGANGWIDDHEVYLMAVDYFSLDDAEIERQKAEREQQQEEERRKREEERTKKAAEDKEKKAFEARQKSRAKRADEDQLSLF